MSLIFRTDLSRPLTHEELDSNFKFLQVKPWDVDDYKYNQLVYVKDEQGVTTIYRCVEPHIRYTYEPTNIFTTTIATDNGPMVLWEAIANTGGTTGGTSVYDTVISDSVEVPSTVGGITQGTLVSDLRGKTFTEMFDKLLFPATIPVYVNPSLSLSSNVTGLRVINDNVDITLTAIYNRGGILQPWDDNSFQKPRAGTVDWFTFKHDTNAFANQVNVATATLSGLHVSRGSHTLTIITQFSAGPQPLNNYGEPTGTPLPQTTLTSSLTYEGVYPMFATTVNTSTITQLPLYSMITDTDIEINLAAEVDSNRQTILIPTVWLQNRPLQQILYFNSVSNSYSNVDKKSDFIIGSTTRVVNSVIVPYTSYTYNNLMRGAIKIKIIF